MSALSAYTRQGLFHPGLSRVESAPDNAISTTTYLSPTSDSRSSSSTTSPFLPRSKSDLSMSSLPNLGNAQPSASEVTLTPSARSASVAQIREEKLGGLARSLLSRSSRLLNKRKSSNKMRSMDMVSDGTEAQRSHIQEATRARSPKHARLASSGPRWKPCISEPYNFHHLTHTCSTQARTLQAASARELITEFSALRASQAPRRALKGIKADDISAAFSPTTSSFASPVTSFDSPTESRPSSPFGTSSSPEGSRALRHSKSIDSFTRISTKSFSSPKPPVSPPPRRSSRQVAGKSQATAHVSESPTVPCIMTPTSATSSPNSYVSIGNSGLSSSDGTPIPDDSRIDFSEIAQAVTTPDDSAFVFISQHRSASNVGLADVPEEEEDASKRLSKQGSKVPALRHAKSFPSSRPVHPPATERLPWSTPQPEGESWDAPPDPTLSSPKKQRQRPLHTPPPQAEAASLPSPTGHSSWEDDIDYCYEHAMEAEGVDWDSSSGEENIWMNDSTSSSTPTPPLNSQNTSGKPYLNNGPTSPEEPSSATSSSVSVPDLVTPAEPSSSRSDPVLYPLSPSLLLPKEYASRVIHEDSYAQSMPPADTETGKQLQPSFEYYPYDLRVNTNLHGRLSSPRSSGSPISKTASRDSLATGKSSTAASKHRRSSSIGSVPELVPSAAERANARSVAESDQFPIQLIDATYEPDVPTPEPLQISRGALPEPLQIKSHRAAPSSSLPLAPSISPLSPAAPVTSSLLPAPAPAPASALPPAPLSAQLSAVAFASRTRANSEALKPALADLALIGAPRTHSRLRSGSVAMAAPFARPKGHRTSYSLFPQGSMSNLREAASMGGGKPF